MTRRPWRKVLPWLAVFALASQAAAQHHHEPPPRPARATASYDLPDVPLVSASGTRTTLGAILAGDEPLFLQFMFTSCTTVCPVLSASFSALQSRLGPDDANLRLVSISIDPAYDTPERLRDYARRFHAGAQWQFFTGSADDIGALQKAFASYPGNSKMQHVPVTFFRAAHDARWTRIDGLPGTDELLDVYRRTTKR